MEIKVERKRAKSSNRIDRILHYGKLYFFVKKNNQFFFVVVSLFNYSLILRIATDRMSTEHIVLWKQIEMHTIANKTKQI